MISNEFKEVLKLLAKKFKSIKWAALGSTNIALYGIDFSPADIDILTDMDGIKKIDEILKKFQVTPFSYGEKGQFRSYIGKFKIKGIEIEVMANFEIKDKDKWISVSDRLNNINMIEIDGIKIPASSLKAQLEGYKRLNRDKDKIKIKLIEEYLKKII